MPTQIPTPPIDWLTDRLVFVNLDITCWSGKKSLTPEDLGLDRSQLPPETLVSLGEKQLIDPEALRAFVTLRGTARRHCLAVGTRFLGGYAVPTVKAQALLDRLDAVRCQYDAARATFLADYDDRLAAWANQQPPEWRKMIRDALVPADYVGGRLRFAVQAVRFGAPAPTVVTHGGLAAALVGLSGQVLHEIAQLAKETLEKSYQGKAEVTRRALGPVRAIRDKLDGLSFADGRFRAIVGEIDRLLAAVPPQTPIRGRVLDGLRQLLCLAAQPDGLRAFAACAAPVPADLFSSAAGSAFPADMGVEREVEIAPPSAFARNADGGADDEEAVEVALEPAGSPANAEAEIEIESDTEIESETERSASVADAGWFF